MEFFGLKLNEIQDRRLKSLIDTFLRDIRDYIETKSTLIRKIEQGGLGLSMDQAKKVMRGLVKEKANKHGQENFFKQI